MKVKIDLRDAASIDKALSELERFQDRLLNFAADLVNELTAEGVVIAGVKFDEAVYAGINDAKPGRTEVRLTKWKRKATVYVDGKSVLFIEFGTGINKAVPIQEYDEIEKGSVFNHGEYGDGRGSDPNGWWYTGTPQKNPPEGTERAIDPRTGKVKPNSMHTYGNDANSSMYLTRLELEQKYTEIAQRVYERSFGR
jgi:hypothetical protein